MKNKLPKARKPDAYERQIKKLMNVFPDGRFRGAVLEAWIGASGIFSACSPDRRVMNGMGCLTMIRRNFESKAATPELTQAIREDNRIPYRAREIKKSDLPVFAEWQRRLDKELRRKPYE